jgi:hypothetical protein
VAPPCLRLARHPSAGQLEAAGLPDIHPPRSCQVARHPSSEGCQTSILRGLPDIHPPPSAGQLAPGVARHPSFEGCQTSIRRPARSGREARCGKPPSWISEASEKLWSAWRLAKSPRKAAVADSQHGPHMHKAQPSVNRVSGTCCCSRLWSIERRSNSTAALRQFSRQRDGECSRRMGLKRPPWSHRGSASGGLAQRKAS